MINKVEPDIFAMAIADKHDRIRCEKIIIAWDKLSGLVRETLSEQPTREQIALRFYPNRDARFDRYKISI